MRNQAAREHARWITRAAAQAAAPLVVLLVVIELLRREQVVTMSVLGPRYLIASAVVWLAIAIYRGVHERTA